MSCKCFAHLLFLNDHFASYGRQQRSGCRPCWKYDLALLCHCQYSTSTSWYEMLILTFRPTSGTGGAPLSDSYHVISDDSSRLYWLIAIVWGERDQYSVVNVGREVTQRSDLFKISVPQRKCQLFLLGGYLLLSLGRTCPPPSSYALG